MAFSDLFDPDNPSRRDRVAWLHQELIDCMELNFDATNELIGVLNTHCQCKLQPIEVHKKGTIRENCEGLLAAMTAMKGELQAIDERLKKNLEPDLYRKLHDFQEPDTMKMQILCSAAAAVNGVIGTMAITVFIQLGLSMVETGLPRLVSIVLKVSAFTGGTVAGILLGVGVDMILSANLGRIERNKLEEKIQELEGMVQEFKPASKEYSKTIMRVTLMPS